MRKMVSFLVGVLSGAIVATAVVLLVAPSGGADLRERLGVRIQELIEEGKRAAAARRAEMEAQLEAFKRGSPVTGEVTIPEA